MKCEKKLWQKSKTEYMVKSFQDHCNVTFITKSDDKNVKMPITKETTPWCLLSVYVFHTFMVNCPHISAAKVLTSLHSLFHVDSTVWIEYFFMVGKARVHLETRKTNPQEWRHDCKLQDPTTTASDIQFPLKVCGVIPE